MRSSHRGRLVSVAGWALSRRVLPDAPSAGPGGERPPLADVVGGPAGALALLRQIARSASRHRISGLAAEVAFFAVLSLFPGLLAVAAALGSLEATFGGDLAARGQEAVVGFLSQTLTDRASTTVDAVRQLFEERSTGLLTFGAALLLWALSRGFAAAIRALNVAYGVGERRRWIALRLLALGFALGSVVVFALMISVVVLGPLLGWERTLAGWLGLEGSVLPLLRWLRGPIAFGVLIAWSAMLFHVAPATRTPLRWDIPGAFLTAVLWLLISLGFRVYLNVASGGNQVLGVLGGGLILLLWIYLLSLALLLGGEVNGALARRARARAA